MTINSTPRNIFIVVLGLLLLGISAYWGYNFIQSNSNDKKAPLAEVEIENTNKQKEEDSKPDYLGISTSSEPDSFGISQTTSSALGASTNKGGTIFNNSNDVQNNLPDSHGIISTKP